MNMLHRFEVWGDTHHPKYMDIVRIALGIFLIFKGVDFLRHMGIMSDLITRSLSFGSFFVIMLGHYIVFAHIIGGILLALGLLTRFACLIQIPILLGAIIFINFTGDTFRPYSEIILSIVVLLLLIYFLIAGNGPWSFDFDKEEKKR